jgi:hypothetical protein
MPPAVGRAVAISAIDKLTMNDSPPTIVQFANAAVGPPVYMTKPNKTGIPDAKFMLCSSISGNFSDWNPIHLTVKVAALHVVSIYICIPGRTSLEQLTSSQTNQDPEKIPACIPAVLIDTHLG